MRRRDYRPVASTALAVVVIAYMGCSAIPAPSTESATTKPAEAGGTAGRRGGRADGVADR